MKKFYKRVALVTLVALLNELFFPLASYALSGGPSQPEVQSFEPIGTSDMVDLSSGDFVYNIPLLDVDGYPINISYHSGIGMDQEASWVGLGWNINPGVVNRNMRGIPDDFKGDKVVKEYNMKPNQTWGLNVGATVQIVGKEASKLGGSINGGLGICYNNYKGVGFELTFRPGLSAGEKSKSPLTGSLGLSASSENGVGITPSLGFSRMIKSKEGDNELISQSGSVSASFNSRSGLKALTFGLSADKGSFDAKRHWNSSRDFGGANGSGSLSYANPTYVPNIQMPMANLNISFHATLGGEILAAHTAGQIGGYYSEQRLQEPTQTIPAYGYFFSQEMNDNYGMLDFNREKDGSFTQNTPALPITNYSYDIYAVSGQGISGMYKPFRSDIGILTDRASSNESDGGSVGVEFGGGNAVHGGVDFTVNLSNTITGLWKENNAILGDLGFKGNSNVNKFYEPFYFKNVGEKTADPDNSFFASVGGFSPVRVALDDSRMDVATKRSLVHGTDDNESNYISTVGIGRKKRQRRNQNISYLSAAEASVSGAGLGQGATDLAGIPTQDMVSYNEADPNPLTSGKTPVPRVAPSNGRNKHHISEIRTTREDGAIYVYGIAAYNYLQDEITFNSSGIARSSDEQSKGLISYTPGKDDSRDNRHGLDHFYSKSSLPGYAHSYLLTAILSPDYVDLTGNGPTPDDYGTYTKFNYSMVHGSGGAAGVVPYQWRVPIESNEASYSEGLNADANDDKGNIIYGKKEIWYLSSVETKNYIAEFSISPREDGLGVAGPAGGKSSSMTLRKLDKITLYSRYDRVKNATTAVPIKVVNFEYSYDLCPNVPNNSGNAVSVNGTDINAAKGKLTLKKLYFTYGNSKRGKLNSYQFNYANASVGYNLKGYDRWGNYMPNPRPQDGLYSYDYPYTDQDKSTSGDYYADIYASTWTLNQIILPSGGKIDINYESDDYAYVQDKPAMNMVKVQGISNSTETISGDMLINKRSDGNQSNYFVHLKLPEPITASTRAEASEIFRQKYLKDILDNYIYYRFKVRLSGTESPDQYENIAGYAKVEDNPALSNRYGVSPGTGNTYNYAYVRLKAQNIGDRSGSEDVNPIARAAWQFTRLNVPRIAYGQADVRNDGLTQVVKAIMSIAESVAQLVKGFNRQLRSQDFGKKVDLASSYMRLYNPSMHKRGGGCRVKKISINDQWSLMGTGNTNAVYSQTYDYTTPEGYSSGVATYEPLIGGDENPFRSPVFYKEENLMALDNEHYVETPFGESFFPAPSVVYSRVKVTTTAPDPNNTSVDVSTKTGSVVSEFYTAKDFPTITGNTGMRTVPKKPTSFKKILSILKLDNRDYMTASEGYSIELNDMAGKPKAKWVYAEGNPDPISGMEYKYNTDATYPNRLSNDVQVIDNTGAISTKQVGVDVDFVADARSSETQTQSAGPQGNLDAFLLAFFPGVLPSVWPAYARERVKFHSIVTTKVINRYGILNSTIAYQDGARVKTENLAYDQETGEVLLTKTYNEFEKPIYNYTYPAHWAYDRMGPAYKNIGLQFKNLQEQGDGIFHMQNASLYFVDGDEVLVTTGSNSYKYWVHDVTSGSFALLNKDGYCSLGNSLVNVKIIRSGRRNQQTASIGTVTSLDDPYKNQTTSPQFANVLNASVTNYTDHWQTYEGMQSPVAPTCSGASTILQEGTDLGKLLSALSVTGKLNAGTDQILSTITYPDYTSLLRSYLPGTEHRWKIDNIGNPSIKAEIYTVGASSTSCSIVLTQKPVSGATVDWSSIVQIDPTITPLCNSSCIGGDEYTHKFNITGRIRGGASTINIEVTTTCYPIAKCSKCTLPSQYLCGLQINDVINPYYRGVRGDFRANKTLTYLDERKHDNTNQVANGGTFGTFSPYWNFPSSSSGFMSSSAGTKWVWKDQVTKANPHGNQVEQEDALGRYSSQLFGYNKSLVKAVASNAKYTQIAFDNFEDYNIPVVYDCANAGHFDFEAGIANGHAILATSTAHSGRYSIEVTESDSIGVDRKIYSGTCIDNSNANNTDQALYRLHAEDCVGRFSPEDGDCSGSNYIRKNGTYVVSAWVKEDNAGTPPTTYSNAFISVKTDAPGEPYKQKAKVYASGSIIDGWQRIYAVFTVPANATDITVSLCCGWADHAYFDDVRIHPFNSNMKSYVYDPITLRLSAILDENNYATFYEYDEDGALTRVKKETIKGIYTIQEVRAGKYKKSR